MFAASDGCLQCGSKTLSSVSSRCMYCGADLSREEKNQLLTDKMDRFEQTEENADQIIRNMRRDYAIPEKKKRRKKRK